MDILILDTSVVIKPLFKEKGAEKVKQIFFLKDQFKVTVLAPDIIRYEFFNTVSRQKNPVIAMKAYRLLTEKQFSIIPLESDLMEMTSRLMNKYPKISFYGASYHALAKAYNGTFITADRKYFKQTKKEGNIALLDEYEVSI